MDELKTSIDILNLQNQVDDLRLRTLSEKADRILVFGGPGSGRYPEGSGKEGKAPWEDMPTEDMNWQELRELHEVRDYEKFESILNDMKENGWRGAPLVRLDDQLLTGSHRFAAAKELDIKIPTIELRDVFEHYGSDYDQMTQDWEDNSYPSQDFSSWWQENQSEYLPNSAEDDFGLQNG
jgi:hypothetical protein